MARRVPALYLDIDGVLLGTIGGRTALALHAEEFLEFALAHCDCFWLTTHCDGDAQQVIDYLHPFVPEDLLAKLTAIKPTRFRLLKTEVLQGDCYWLEDQPLAAELADLRRRNLHDRWIEINTRLRPDDLLHAIEELKLVLKRRGP